MKLYIKNNLISLRGSSSVKDENKQDVFIVKGTFFSITHKKRIKDLEGNLLYKVRNKWFQFITHSAYVYDGKGNKVAKVKRKFGFKNVFICRNGEIVGTVRRAIDWTDSFVLETDTEQDGAFLVALVIAIDNIFDDMSNSNR